MQIKRIVHVKLDRNEMHNLLLAGHEMIFKLVPISKIIVIFAISVNVIVTVNVKMTLKELAS